MKNTSGIFEKQSEDFKECMVKMKASYYELQKKIKELEDLKVDQKARIVLADQSYQRQIKNEDIVKNKLHKAETTLGDSEAKKILASQILISVEKKQVEVELEAKQLAKQKINLDKRQRELDDLEGQLEFVERKLRLDRKYVDQVREDMKIKKELGE